MFPLPRRVFRTSLLFGRERMPAIVPNDLIVFLSRAKSYASLSFVADRSITEIKNYIHSESQRYANATNVETILPITFRVCTDLLRNIS